MSDAVKLSLEQRRERLQEAITSQMVPGMTIEAQTDISASLAFAGGHRRIFTIAEDGSVQMRDYAPGETHTPAAPGPPVTGFGMFIRLMLVLGVVGFVIFLAIAMQSSPGPRSSSGGRGEVAYQLRSSPLMLQITLTTGPDALHAAEIEVNDRWTCGLGEVRLNVPVEVSRSACVTDAGIGLPMSVTVTKTTLRSRVPNVVKTLRWQ